jgi:hypothetical protein
MSGKGKKATISPDPTGNDPGDRIADTMPSRRSSRAKRRQEETDTPHDGTGTGSAAKVARLASAEEETKGREGDATSDTSLTTEKITNLIKDLWRDDENVIVKTLNEIADIGLRDASPDYKNELEMRELGVHSAVFQVLQKHIGCLEIQEEAIRALGNLSFLIPTNKLLGKIGCVEVILARMEKYRDSESVQEYGCFLISKLVNGAKDNAEHVEKSGGIATVIAAMKAYQHIELVQYRGCVALSNMSEWEEYRPLIMDAGGASAIASAMEKSGHPQLRERAYEAMENLIKKPR